ncbi:putative SWEET sugar transporter [Helianthus debilis subsp. tardiflorus]
MNFTLFNRRCNWTLPLFSTYVSNSTSLKQFFYHLVHTHPLTFFFYRITFRRILKNKSTEEFSGIPYPMTLLNCLLSAWYGLPFISENNTLVTVINGTGAAIEAVYVLIFLIYAPKKEKAKVFWLAIFVLAAFSTVAVVSVAALHGKTRRYFCGFAASVFSVIMYGSPLSIMVILSPIIVLQNCQNSMISVCHFYDLPSFDRNNIDLEVEPMTQRLDRETGQSNRFFIYFSDLTLLIFIIFTTAPGSYIRTDQSDP